MFCPNNQLCRFESGSASYETFGSAEHEPTRPFRLEHADGRTPRRKDVLGQARSADDEWKEVARDCLHQLAETMDELTADDLVELLETMDVKTHNLAALGPVFLNAKKKGWIENTGRRVRTRIPRRHRELTVWKSLLR